MPQRNRNERGTFVWTPEADATLRKMLGKYTHEHIGRVLGVSKNSVCGRVKRLGLQQSIRLVKTHPGEPRNVAAPITLPKIPRSRILDPDT